MSLAGAGAGRSPPLLPAVAQQQGSNAQRTLGRRTVKIRHLQIRRNNEFSLG